MTQMRFPEEMSLRPTSRRALQLLAVFALAASAASAEDGPVPSMEEDEMSVEEDVPEFEDDELDTIESIPAPDDGLAVLAFAGLGVTTAPMLGVSGGFRVQQWTGPWGYGGDLGFLLAFKQDGRRAYGWGSETQTTTYRSGGHGLARLSRQFSPGKLVVSVGAGVEHGKRGSYVKACTKPNFSREATCGDATSLGSDSGLGPVGDLSLGLSMRRHRFDVAAHVQGRLDGAFVYVEVAGGWVVRPPGLRRARYRR